MVYCECCKQSIFINPSEYEILKYNISRLDYSIKARLKLESKNICDAIKKTKIPIEFSKFLTGKEQENINKEYFQFQFKCPLLNSEGECICYNTRPTVCWTYRNYGHPYIICDTEVTKKMYEIYPLKSSNFRLLAYAICEILK